MILPLLLLPLVSLVWLLGIPNANKGKRLTQEIEKLCKEGINLIEEGVDIPNDLLDDYDRHEADFENSKKEAEKAYERWTWAVTYAKNDNGRNRSKEEIQRDYDVANQLVRELVQLKNETDGKYHDLNRRRKVLERMEKDCLRKKKEMKKQYGEEITHKLKQHLETMKQTLKRT
ncbi:hypothetical protein BASA83_008999 [Batrachochytrium salamandrivorans]|nr:hypothetical protein BASA83_008999 [Batrachochytrium salamandrivorans]